MHIDHLSALVRSRLHCQPSTSTLLHPSQCRALSSLQPHPLTPKTSVEKTTPHRQMKIRTSPKTYSTSSPHQKQKGSRGSGKSAGGSEDPREKGRNLRKRAEEAAARARANSSQMTRRPKHGSLAENSLFSDRNVMSMLDQTPAEDDQELDPFALERRDPSRLATVLNPKPEARTRGLQRRVVQSIRHRGRLSKTVKLARTERSSLCRSDFFKTSMKKLAPLARQIAGKPIDHAILQMRFSKKKVAQDVHTHLVYAKNEAIVTRGMGLPEKSQAAGPDPSIKLSSATASASPIATTVNLQPPPNVIISDASTAASAAASAAPGTATGTATTQPTSLSDPTSEDAADAPSPLVPQQQQQQQPPPPRSRYLPGTVIPSKPINRKPTDIYIAQAWINRGPYEEAADHRAFGRINLLRPPSTGISVLLKEERTRVREMREKEEKAIKKRIRPKSMWTQLPDRKITRQSQYVLW